MADTLTFSLQEQNFVYNSKNLQVFNGYKSRFSQVLL